jgi:hypothetical protein
MAWPAWSDVGPIASALSFLLAFWLARRTLAGERPRLRLYASRIVDAQIDLHERGIGALVEVNIVNLSRVPNAVRIAEISLVRGDANAYAPEGDWRRGGDGTIELQLSPNVRWAIHEELARFPLTVGGFEARSFLMFVIAPATEQLFREDEWQAIGAGQMRFLAEDLESNALVVDVHEKAYVQELDFKLPGLGEMLLRDALLARRNAESRLRAFAERLRSRTKKPPRRLHGRGHGTRR